MIYTIGLSTLKGTTPLGLDSEVHLISEDYVIVHVTGNRCSWQQRFPDNSFRLLGILPTLEQKQMLEEFLQKGGTVITSLVNPRMPITVSVFQEEIQENMIINEYVHEVEGDIADLIIPPYDWLSASEWRHLPQDAYHRYLNIQGEVQAHLGGDVLSLTRTHAIGFCYGVGESGRIVFTPLRNVAFQMEDLVHIIELLENQNFELEGV